MTRPKQRPERRSSRWAVPGVCAGFGTLMLATSWIGGHPGQGVWMLAVLLGYGALLLLGGRNEIVAVLAGRPRDERWQLFDLRAVALAGVAVLLVALGGAFYELALGRSGMPYTLLCAVGGAAYLAGVIAQGWRA